MLLEENIRNALFLFQKIGLGRGAFQPSFSLSSAQSFQSRRAEYGVIQYPDSKIGAFR
jgi:hypothetical protein